MNVYDWISGVSMVLGAMFFCAGTIGLLRFPDIYTRLHALTKADNMGLALIIFALAWQAEAWWDVAKLVLIWGLVMLAGTTCCHIVAQVALRADIAPWRTRSGEQPSGHGGMPDDR